MRNSIIVDITPGLSQPILYYSQNDVGTELVIKLKGIDIPAGATVTLRATKPSGFGFTAENPTISGNTVTFITTEDMTDEYGRFPAEINITNEGMSVGTANFIMAGEKNPHPEGTTDGQAEEVIPELTQLVERVEEAASSVLDRQTVTNTLPAGSQASYSFDEETNTQTFGIPEGQAGSGAVGTAASAYSATKTYAVGDYAIQNGNLYRCTTAITTAESFTAAHWTQVVLGDDVTQLKSDISGLQDDAFEYTTQYLDANKKTSGQFYYANLITTGSADGYCTFPPIQLKANKTYTLVNVRTHFTNYKVGDTITTLDASDAGTANKTIQFTPESDGQLYVTGGDAVNVMVFDGTHSQTDYVYGKFDYRIKNESIGKQITEHNCTFFKDYEQLLKLSDVTVGRYWNIWQGKVDYFTNANTTQYARIPLKAGETYTFINVYGCFTWIANADATPITALSTDVNPIMTLEYTPTVDCYAYVTKINTVTNVMVVNSNEYFPTEYVEGIYKTVFDFDTSDTEKNITVKKNGGGNYTSVVDAVNFANQQSGKAPINIYIYSGDYDILEELGGQDFIDTIESSTNERQGLVLLRDNVNLIGVGHVILRYEMPDTVTYNQATRTSCLNLREFSNRIENLTLIAKNCRCAIHDETNGGNPHITRVMKNIRAIHKGNASGLWPYPTVLGGGAGGGSDYTFIDCQFITNSHNMAWSYHTNYNEEPSFFNVDGCVGIVNDSNGYSFRMSYHGTGRTGITVGNIKCCSGNGKTIVTAESSGDTDNNIEMYVNGYETIPQIIVSGNE